LNAEQNALIEQFTTVAGTYTATVSCITRSAQALTAELRRITAAADRILLAEPDDLEPRLFEPFRSGPGVVFSPTEAELASAEFGISDAFAAIASTGSVCVSVTKGLGGSVSLFARKHVAVVDANTIVARPGDLLLNPSLREKTLNRDFVFISGPSATADMGPLVRGVHGPGKVHVVILT
jgi:L-lactate dehydrogenase complex protein LldG